MIICKLKIKLLFYYTFQIKQINLIQCNRVISIWTHHLSDTQTDEQILENVFYKSPIINKINILYFLSLKVAYLTDNLKYKFYLFVLIIYEVKKVLLTYINPKL